MDYLDEGSHPESTWRNNYATLAPLEDKVLEVLHDQASRGQILVLPEAEARKQYPSLVASLGANRKDKPDGQVTARLLFDGTNGLEVNKKTRIRDQERAPIAADLKRAMRAKAARGESTFAVTADVTEAHRQVPIHPHDWKFLGCQVKPGGDVFINTVGPFGLASASYYWSRISAALGRLKQYMSGKSAVEAGESDFRFPILSFFILTAVLGVPLSWHKTLGGDVLVWVGFELLLESRKVGISQRRAEWFVRWSSEIASAPTVHMRSFEEALGRIMFVVGALEYERPFLAPLQVSHDAPT